MTLLFWVYISFLWGQISPHENGYKLLAFDKNDQFVADALIKGTDIIFAVPSVDSVLGNMPGYPYRGTRMIRMDSAMQIVADVNIRPDSMTAFSIFNLFWWAPDVIGFVGQGTYIDTLNNDSSVFFFVGSMLANFSQIQISKKYFIRSPYSYGSGFPALKIKDAFPVNDSILLVSLAIDTIVYHGYKYYLLSFEKTNSGISLLDSMVLYPSVPAITEGGFFYYYTGLSDPHLFYIQYPLSQPPVFSNSPGNIINYHIVNAYPIQIAPYSTILPGTGHIFYNSNQQGNILKPVYQGDTLWVYGFQDTIVTLYKLVKNGLYGFFLYDSVRIKQPLYYSTRYHVENMSIGASNLFLLETGESVPYVEVAFNFVDFVLWHDSSLFLNPIFRISVFNPYNLVLQGQILLGGDAIYSPFGIIAPSDSVCIVYGWRFPFGDLTRTDGDAFIWKISWNSGIVTSVLGETPEYVFKMFPNPASERLQVQGKTKHATTLLLRSSDGKELLRKEFSAETTLRELDVSNLPKGVYVLEILSETGWIFSEKVVLE